MDPLTHTLVGASLSATRLGETTRRAVPALVIGANLPDVDVLAYFAGEDAALDFRRGWTHGVLALVVLPALLALLLLAWDRWRPAAGPRRLHPGWLFGLCYLAVLTHPVLDWLNTYGMRWLMPFDGTWFYGDSVFIMDPWLWLILGTGWLAGRRRRRGLLITWGVVSGLLLLIVARRGTAYLPVLVAVLLTLLLALLWQPSGRAAARRGATVGLGLAAVFIGGMLVLHEVAEGRVRAGLRRYGVHEMDQLMVGPLPLNPLGWEFVVSSGGRLRHGEISLRGGTGPQLSEFDRANARDKPTWRAIRAGGQAPGFVGWARFPWLGDVDDSPRGAVSIFDARYTRTATPGFGSTSVELTE